MLLHYTFASDIYSFLYNTQPFKVLKDQSVCLWLIDLMLTEIVVIYDLVYWNNRFVHLKNKF